MQTLKLGDAKDLPTANRITDVVAKAFGLQRSELFAKTREPRISKPRQYAMALTRQMTSWPLTRIARRYNLTDHGTVLWAEKRVNPTIMATLRNHIEKG